MRISHSHAQMGGGGGVCRGEVWGGGGVCRGEVWWGGVVAFAWLFFALYCLQMLDQSCRVFLAALERGLPPDCESSPDDP